MSPPASMVVPTVTTQSFSPNMANLPKSSLPSSPESMYSADLNSPSLSDENDPLGINTSDSDETSLAIDLTQEGLLGNQCMDQYNYLSGKNWVSDNYTAGLCLLVILFSFGLFFNGVLLEGISVMVAPSLPGAAPTTTGRTLFESHIEDLEDIIAGMSTDTSDTENSIENESLEEDNNNTKNNKKEEIKKLLVYGGDDPHLTPYL